MSRKATDFGIVGRPLVDFTALEVKVDFEVVAIAAPDCNPIK